jgi:dihydrofolate reductase
VVVLSSRAIAPNLRGAVIEQMSGSPAEITDRLAAGGAAHASIDGGITVQRFIRARLVQRLIITRVPVLIGEGIPLFGALPHDVQLRHIQTNTYPSGLVKSEYEIVN